MVRIKKNELLSKHTSFKIGGPAKYFCETNTLEELKAALKYANKKNIPYVIIAGPEEVKKNIVKLKDMKTGDQKELTIEEVAKKLC